MGSKAAAGLVLVLTLPFWIPGAAGPAAAADKGPAPPTAKARLAHAAAEAKKWQADAALTYVSTDTAAADGTAPMWMYLYDSPKTKEQ